MIEIPSRDSRAGEGVQLCGRLDTHPRHDPFFTRFQEALVGLVFFLQGSGHFFLYPQQHLVMVVTGHLAGAINPQPLVSYIEAVFVWVLFHHRVHHACFTGRGRPLGVSDHTLAEQAESGH